MNKMTLFGVGTPAGTARDLVTVWPSHAAHAAHAFAAPAPARIAEQRKRRTAAATNASVDGGNT